MKPISILLLVAVALTVATQLVAREPSEIAPAHHRVVGFQNNHLEFEPKGLMTFLQWQVERLRHGHPKPAQGLTPKVEPDLAFITANAKAGESMQPAVTWIGHATMLVQFAGLNALTDPIFSERASPLSFIGPRRAQPPGIALADLPRIDLVLISHNHYDHLDEASVRALAAQAGGPPLFVVPLGNKAWFTEIGIDRVVELDWWQSHHLESPTGPVEVVLTPVQHWSGRTLTDRMVALWGGFAVFSSDFQFFHAGDTGYSTDFQEIARRFANRQRDGGFDLALLPIGAYAPRWFMKDQHVDPAEAVQIHRDLGARRSVAYHWGTFSLSDEALDDPPVALAAARRAQGIVESDIPVLAIGETLRLPWHRSKGKSAGLGALSP